MDCIKLSAIVTKKAKTLYTKASTMNQFSPSSILITIAVTVGSSVVAGVFLWTSHIQHVENQRILDQMSVEKNRKEAIEDISPSEQEQQQEEQNASEQFLAASSSLLGGVKQIPTQTNAAGETPLTSATIAIHNQKADCWVTIDSKVYDVTKFLVKHPGGPTVIKQYCGKDATVAYKSKNVSPARSHSSQANDMLPLYYIGTLGSKPTAAKVAATSNNVAITQSVIQLVSKQDQPSVSPTPTPTPTPAPAPTTTGTTYTTSQVATHNTSANCWMIISDKIYDLSSFMEQHPGGVSVLTPYCGRDGTVAFQTKSRVGGSHSLYAYSLLPVYYVANLSVTTPTPTPTPAPTPKLKLKIYITTKTSKSKTPPFLLPIKILRQPLQQNN
jgi:cytochrome b involved in lipid metabolism